MISGILYCSEIWILWANVQPAGFSEGEAARLKESIPLRRFGDPREVADAAVFLVRNEYANNCVLNLDGGLSAV